MNIVEKKLGELQPYENNPRKNDTAVPYVAESIKRYGFKVPIVIDKDGVIVAGHTRYLASIELGLETVPCIVADDLTDEEIKEFRLVDNKTSEFAGWDFDMLSAELEDLDFDGADFGFEMPKEESDEEEGETSDSFNYHEQYGVIVMCADEAEQERIYNSLTEEGYECKVVAV